MGHFILESIKCMTDKKKIIEEIGNLISKRMSELLTGLQLKKINQMISIQIQGKSISVTSMIQDYGASIKANEAEFNLQYPDGTTYTQKHHITYRRLQC